MSTYLNNNFKIESSYFVLDLDVFCLNVRNLLTVVIFFLCNFLIILLFVTFME